MGSRQKTGAEVAYLEPDEKGWIDGSASAGLSLAHHTSPQDEAARVCGDWLGRADEVESLSTRWGDIEAGLIKSHGWSELTDQQQRETPEANELYEIDARIESLINKQTETLRALPELKATTRAGVMLKFEVLAQILRSESYCDECAFLERTLSDLSAVWR